MEEKLRLNKFLAEKLGISRRQADNLIAAGKILVSGKPAVLGARIDKNDEVCYNGSIEALGVSDDVKGLLVSRNNQVVIPTEVSYTYLGLNKPAGYVCSRRSQDQSPTVYELLPERYRNLKTVGRLDRDSSGLILLTNDGDFAFRMTHPKFIKSKVYLVRLDRALEPLHQQEIADFGIEIGDGISRLGLTRIDEGRKKWRVEMSEGRNRQIRRTFGALGYTVVGLHRIQFGPYQLDGLKSGEFIEIQPVK